MTEEVVKAKPVSTKSASQKEMDNMEKNFQEFSDSVKDMTMDRMNKAPKEDSEQQTKLSQKELNNSKDIYLKPKRSLSSPEKFNDKYRKDYDFAKEYVCFIAENKEIIGEDLTLWTKPFAGMPAEEWEIPVNKPVWG